MIEIFTTVAGQSNSTSRVFSNDIRISTPSDVHFGSGAAGIAFYEKSGADLKVTLLDGQEVMIRDFFVIGESGQYSRLRDGGAAGDIEVTGLIAPEPYVPPGVTQTATTDSALPEADSVSTGALSDPEALPAPVEVAQNGGGAAPVSTVPEGAASSAGNTFGGFSFDQIAFGLSMLPAAALILRSDKDDDAPAPPVSARLALQDGAPGAADDGNDEPDAQNGEADPPMQEDLAELIRGILAGDAPDTPPQADQGPAFFGTDPGDGPEGHFGSPDPTLALFDPMHFISIEG